MTNIDEPQSTPSPNDAVPRSAHSTDAVDTSKPEAIASTASVEELSPAPTNDAKELAETTTSSPPSSQSYEQEEEPTPSLPPRPADLDTPAPVSPEVASLRAMFPDFDVVVLQSVLDSVRGDQERAADVLLGMSDPSYVSQQHNIPTQTDLDEQLARRLMLEDQQQQAEWHPDQAYPYGPVQGQQNNVPYQARVPGGSYPTGGQGQWGNAQGNNGRDTMTEVSEQFSKIAETGKKTFSSLFTKVKAKMQEFDQSRTTSGSSSQTSWGSGTPSGAQPGNLGQGQYHTSVPPQSQAPTQYYAPGPGPNDYGQNHDYRQTQGYGQAQGYGQTQGYDAAPQPAPVPAAGTGNTFPGMTARTPSADRIPPRPPSAGPPPAGNVDPTKIGMLPKRPVSLLGSTPPQSNTLRKDDEDELDYVENPFEEERK